MSRFPTNQMMQSLCVPKVYNVITLACDGCKDDMVFYTFALWEIGVGLPL